MKPILSPELSNQIDTLAVYAKGSYIFYGASGTGKRTTALWLAKRLNCLDPEQDNCQNCRLIEKENYPDLLMVSPDEQSIGISEIQDLQKSLSLSQYNPDGRRIIIIDAAEKMTLESQNCLLKILEEPPVGSVIILIASEIGGLLSTVLSRCSRMYFAELSQNQVEKFLIAKMQVELNEAKIVSKLASGRIGLAINLVKSSSARQAYLDAANLADNIINSNKFERLVMASKAVESPKTLDIVLSFMISRLQHTLRDDEASQNFQKISRQLESLSRFYEFRQANVNIRAAFEGLMLEL